MSGLPRDFDDALWLRPHVFAGLVGASLARDKYRDLFRSDGFAKTEADLRAIPWIAEYLERRAS